MARGQIRLFVAAYPPEGVARSLLDQLNPIALREGAPAWRETPPEQVHLTLQFIGDRRPDELESTIESVRRSASGIGAFAIVARRLITVPDRGASRLIAAEASAPAPLLELHRRLAKRLARSPSRGDADGFLPHLTLCRFKGEAPGFRVDEPLDGPEMVVERVVVVRSVQHADGVEHRANEVVELGDGAC